MKYFFRISPNKYYISPYTSFPWKLCKKAMEDVATQLIQNLFTYSYDPVREGVCATFTSVPCCITAFSLKRQLVNRPRTDLYVT